MSAQRTAERLMVDACTIRRATGRTFNETTGQYTPTTSVIYSGKCKVQIRGSSQGEAQAGDREVVTLSTELHLPMSVTAVLVDDVATIVISLDPALVGRKLRVQQLFYKTYATARRLPVEDVTA